MSSAHTESGTKVVMPQMGVSVAEGTIAAWLKSVGDRVAADEPICEVTTDKIDVEIPAPAGGRLLEILAEEGETVAVGTPIAVIGADGANEPDSNGQAAGPDADATPRAAAGAGPAGAPQPGHPREDDARETTAFTGGEADSEIDRSGFFSPVVRRIAAERGVDLSEVEGHGVGGRVRKADLIAHLARDEDAERAGRSNGHDRALHIESPYRPEPEPAEPEAAATAPGAGDDALAELVGPTRREPIDPMRRAIAGHMVRSRDTAAHCTTVVEADFSAVASARAARREELARRGVPLTYLAFVARAAVEALQEHPVLNASLEGDEIVYHEDVNLGIAVALDEGLVVPVIRRAQRLSLEGLAAAIAELAERARAGRLDPDDLAGGTFTITNPGRFGAVIATPIIHQPQVAILDLEAIVRRPVLAADAAGGESIAVRPMSYLCMSWDHRALDGAGAARFLGSIRERIERGDSR